MRDAVRSASASPASPGPARPCSSRRSSTISIHGGRLPLFKAYSSGRVTGARLEPQPDDAVPRFDYERHVRALVDERIWPDSTRQISELRLTIALRIRFVSVAAAFGSGTPPSRHRRLSRRVAARPAAALQGLRRHGRASAIAAPHARPAANCAAHWLARLADGRTRPRRRTRRSPASSPALFTDYLRACRADGPACSTLPPGRFLMPGDLDGSPALTFAPLDLGDGDDRRRARSPRMMARRYEAYKTAVVRPFFRDHFARLDRQIVLVDALEALNAGPDAVAELEAALADILASFRLGRTSWLERPGHPPHRPHPVRRHQGRPSPPRRPRPPRGDPRPDRPARHRARPIRRRQRRRAGARLGPRHPRGDRDAPAASSSPSIIGTPLARRDASTATSSTATPRSPCFPATCPSDPESVFQAGMPSRPTAALRPLPTAEARADRGRPDPVAAPYPARPRARIPDRRPAGMTTPAQADRLPPRRMSTISADYVPGLGAPPVLTTGSRRLRRDGGRARPCRGRRARPRWSRILLAALGGLLALAIGLADRQSDPRPLRAERRARLARAWRSRRSP